MSALRTCAVCAAVAVLAVSVAAHAFAPSPAPPPSPCPQVFKYEASPSAAAGWRGVVRLLAPPRFASLHLGVSLETRQLLPADPGGGGPATLTLRGGVAAARALVRAAQQGRRHAIEFVADFACGVTAVPSLVNVTVNGRLFCSAHAEPVATAVTKSTISLVSDLETGLEWATAGNDEFTIAPEGSKVTPSHDDSPTQPQSPCLVNAITPSVSSVPSSVPAVPAPPAPPAPPSGPLRGSVSSPTATSAGTTVAAFLPNVDTYNVPQSAPYVPPPPPPPPPAALPPPPGPAATPPPPPVQDATYYRPGPPTSNAYEPIPTSNEECGRPWGGPNPLVTRGSAAPRGRWPWLVALFKKLGRRDQLGLNFECGASLVSRKHVVTAAHCVDVRSRRSKPKPVAVDPALLVVYLGKHDLLSYTEPGQQTAEVGAVRIHPDYGKTASGYDNDLALLVLLDAVDFSKTIRPVCLWDPALGGTDVSAVAGKIGAVPGWGKDDTGAISNEIRVANMPIVTQETCLRSNIFYHTFTSNTTFCAGFKNGTSVCNGDSGGGLFIKGPDNRWRIRGIVSVSMFNANEQSCDSYNYAVFTDVAQFLPWLHDQMYSTWSSR